ncbi:MAG: PQQ-dependent dehydrogenase, methanol/ethanol family [Hyphomonadaceae bacterium]
MKRGAKHILAVLGFAVLFGAASCSRPEGANWTSYGGDSTENHYSPLTEINAENVNRLRLAWSYDLPVTPNGLGAPLAIDGVLYFPVGHSVIHAMDAQTGRLLWQYDPHVYDVAGHRMRAGWGNRGLAYRNGKIYTGTLDGRLIAIDARTGREVWSAQTLEPDTAQYITGPPYVLGDLVAIGNGGGDYGPARGYVTAYNAETGAQAWRFYTVPGNPADGFEDDTMRMAAETWTGEWWRLGGGGTVWHAMAYDPEFNRLYIGTGNGLPWNQRLRSPEGGDNLFLCAIVALDADTGEYVWHYQVNPGETWDFNAAMDIELTELTINGQRRPVLMQAPKNGFFYVIDRENGQLISAGQFAENQNWAERIDLETGRPVERPEARYPNGSAYLMYPSSWGAHGVAPMSFNRNNGLVYIPVTEAGQVYTDAPNLAGWTPADGIMRLNSGLGPRPATMTVPPASSSLLAWDPVNQREVWRQPRTGMQNGGTLTTAGNLVFQGQVTGQFTAMAADTGQELWSFDAQVGIGAQPVTYLAGGRQYVTILAGWRGSGPSGMPVEWNYYTQRRRVLTFVLDGEAELPPLTEDDAEPPLLDDPAFRIDTAKADLGRAVFHRNCHVCHGGNLVSGGAAPDLRRAQSPMTLQGLTAVLHDGSLRPRGMPQYEEMPPAEIEALQHFIRQQARAAITAQAAPAPAPAQGNRGR